MVIVVGLLASFAMIMDFVQVSFHVYVICKKHRKW